MQSSSEPAAAAAAAPSAVSDACDAGEQAGGEARGWPVP